MPRLSSIVAIAFGWQMLGIVPWTTTRSRHESTPRMSFRWRSIRFAIARRYAHHGTRTYLFGSRLRLGREIYTPRLSYIYGQSIKDATLATAGVLASRGPPSLVHGRCRALWRLCRKPDRACRTSK